MIKILIPPSGTSAPVTGSAAVSAATRAIALTETVVRLLDVKVPSRVPAV